MSLSYPQTSQHDRNICSILRAGGLVGPFSGGERTPTHQWWRKRISESMATAEDPVPISEPRKPLPSNFRPALVVGLDGRRFVAKGLQRHRTDEPLGRRLFADQVVGRLGVAMGAPVADVTLLHLSKDIADSNVATMHLDPGTLHGSIFRDDLEPGWEDIEFLNEAENRQRFAQLAVLFGWMHADDQQFMYHRTPPHLVVSVDHDYFFHGAPTWNASTLSDAPPAVPDPYIVDGADLTPDNLFGAILLLERIRPDTIASAVSKPPASWGVDLEERIAVASYLDTRRRHLLATSEPDR